MVIIGSWPKPRMWNQGTVHFIDKNVSLASGCNFFCKQGPEEKERLCQGSCVVPEGGV